MTFAKSKRAAARIAARANAPLVALVAVVSLVSATLSIAPAAAQQPARSAAPATPAGGDAAPPPAEVSRRPALGGYLGPRRLPDHRMFLPPPPAVGSTLAAADVAIFEQTRKLENGARWQLAASDNQINHKALLADFGCAVGLDLSAVDAPALSRVLIRSRADLFPLVGAAKDAYKRPRPYVDQQAPLCIVPTDELTASGSYPSGHAATGWLYALLLAEVDTEHADAILRRGRAFGESRVVCGVHYVSDIEAGWLTASALVAELHGAPQFETDIASARAELFSLRGRTQPAAAACESENASLATPW
jgi:acid phosphatase (class A)